MSGTDNSFFVADSPGVGTLFYGDGGTDDAEDPDIVLHEYGHAIQESIAPGAFNGSSSSQARALGEGFGDYWSFASNYDATVPSGRDPFCIGDWDARCANDNPDQLCGYPLGADCLRRVDGTKTMADFINSDVSGTEHQNGEIWSSALREIFITIGRRTTDTLVLEATFGVAAGPTFAQIAERMLAADRTLNNGANISAICLAMTKRGILGSADCSPSPRGEVTWFQSTSSTITITDPRPIVNLTLHTSIIGDAQVTLMGPDGTRGDPGAFRGKSAAGQWTLVITSPQPVTLVSWSLAVQFQGDTPAATRPATSGKFIAAAGNAPGANGTRFITDVRL
ncbi:MAG TPA: M36 family metallopeptidase, partial [Candidatus Tumulicola sp.]|nr:M36 family metallopeptidase [Candidatus Tumulicola sp.]